jgi:pyrroline-5-carboxylate reductase
MRRVLLGGGVMGESILAGMLDAHDRPGATALVEQRPDRARELADRYRVHVAATPDDVVGGDTGVLVVAVKPHDVATALADVSERLPSGCVVVSVAAGVTTASLEDALPVGQPVVRAMPNTPALVGAGVTAICAGQHTTDDHLEVAESLLSAVGSVVRVPETQMDAVAAVSGSGPAYVYLVAEAMIEAGVRVGLPRDLATMLTRQTIAGAARLWDETGDHPGVLRERVTSPGGTTAAALHELESRGLRAAFLDAVVANRDRSLELGGD